MRAHRAVTLTVLALTLLLLCRAEVTDARQDMTFTVQGRLDNGTAGASLPESLPVSLFAFTSDAIVGTWETQTDASGFFEVAGVPETAGAALALVVDYEEVSYSARVTRAEGQSRVTQDLTIYESVTLDPGLRFEQTAIVIGEDPARSGTLSINEIHSITNPTDRTFAPRADGPGGPAGLLVFGLPPDAAGLTPGLGLDASRIVQIGRGFASFVPVTPGRMEVSYSYRLGYAQSDLRIERTVRYPVDLFRVIAPRGGPSVASEQLTRSEVVAIGDRQHQTLAGGPFAPGTLVALSISGLNVPGGIFASVPPAVPVAVGTAVGLLAIGFYWVRVQRSIGDASDA